MVYVVYLGVPEAKVWASRPAKRVFVLGSDVASLASKK